jgi:hypothetical protein
MAWCARSLCGAQCLACPYRPRADACPRGVPSGSGYDADRPEALRHQAEARRRVKLPMHPIRSRDPQRESGPIGVAQPGSRGTIRSAIGLVADLVRRQVAVIATTGNVSGARRRDCPAGCSAQAAGVAVNTFHSNRDWRREEGFEPPLRFPVKRVRNALALDSFLSQKTK